MSEVAKESIMWSLIVFTVCQTLISLIKLYVKKKRDKVSRDAFRKVIAEAFKEGGAFGQEPSEPDREMTPNKFREEFKYKLEPNNADKPFAEIESRRPNKIQKPNCQK